MSDVPLADTCACGVDSWHKLAGPVAEGGATSSRTMPAARLLWCRRCGAIRFIFESQWQIPLDRAGDVARSTRMPSEPPTDPGTPDAKRGK